MKILVVGATSAIAEATARIWAARGESIYLVARREGLLAASAADLKMRGADRVGFERFDVLDRSAHAAMLQRAQDFLGGLDCVLIAHGSLPDQRACDLDPEQAVRELEINGVSSASLLVRLAALFEIQSRGTICVITSVAGCRGRANNYVYGSAKALLSTLSSGLRQRLHRKGVRVVDVRPGFVDTPMTQAFTKGPLWAAPAKVAADIVAGIERGSAVVYTPWFWRWIMLVIRLLPDFIFVRTRL